MRRLCSHKNGLLPYATGKAIRLGKKCPRWYMSGRTRPYFRRGPHVWGRRSKLLLFFDICKKKMQNVKSKCIFFLIFLLLYARRIGGLASRRHSLHVRPIIRPRVRHFVYCVRIAFGHSQMRRPARFVLNAIIIMSIPPDAIWLKK